ncbi:hypothetical protein IKF15_01555 [Candidatus Saccharibacteria bacterium]|nr:hypothetical protein [Candidatus Saccharibacteria bacterium]
MIAISVLALISSFFISQSQVLATSGGAMTASRYFDTWYFELKSNGTLMIKPRNNMTSAGLSYNFDSKADWDNIWKKSYNDSTDIRPYVKKVVFEMNNIGVKFSFNGFRATSMFEGFTKTTEFAFAGLDASEAVSLKNFFKDDTGLDALDLHRFGAMPKILNMDGLIEGCSNLTYLRLDNMDNSNIGPTNKQHSITGGAWPGDYYNGSTDYELITKEDSMITGAAEYGREIFGVNVYDIPAAFPKLTQISAKNSNIWLTKNSRGRAGSEYYIAANDSDVLYLFNKQTEFTPDGQSAIMIDSKRDYIDLIIDRDSIKKHTTLPDINPLPDSTTNLNIQKDYNPNGAGHLAPGVYKISTTDWATEQLDVPKTYYRIAYIGEVPFKIEGIEASAPEQGGTDPELILVQSQNYAWLNTQSTIQWPDSGDYTIDRTANPIKIIYENAAIDVNGKKHNVAITINKITFKNLERIPKYTGNERTHDHNKYIDRNPYDPDMSAGSYSYSVNEPDVWGNLNNGEYYRTILRASRDDGVMFSNYVKVGQGNITPGTSSDWQVLSGGSGTDIDFTVSIEGANPDTTFIFYGEDLDVPESQDWVRPNDDADFDRLPIENAKFGTGGESFALDSNTNDLSSVTFAKQTGLKLVDDKIITTGSDPNTPWSEFAVKSRATGANYVWQTGIACTTYALKNTDKLSLGELAIEPIAKVFNGGELVDGQFDFTLTPDSSVAGNMATGASLTATNDASGKVSFDAFRFDGPTTTIGDTDYYPGTLNDATNSHGNGVHNSYTYAWIVEEKRGDDPLIDYDAVPKRLKIVVSTPENDAEMLKGIKADIYVDETLVKTVWSEEVKDNKYIDGLVFENIAMKEVALKINWNDNNNQAGTRPTSFLNGSLTYELDGSRRMARATLVSDDGGWTLDGDNTQIYRFIIPKNARVVDWGEGVVPEAYRATKGDYVEGSDVYEWTNTLLPKPAPKSLPVNPAPPKTGDTLVRYLVILGFGVLGASGSIYYAIRIWRRYRAK